LAVGGLISDRVRSKMPKSRLGLSLRTCKNVIGRQAWCGPADSDKYLPAYHGQELLGRTFLPPHAVACGVPIAGHTRPVDRSSPRLGPAPPGCSAEFFERSLTNPSRDNRGIGSTHRFAIPGVIAQEVLLEVVEASDGGGPFPRRVGVWGKKGSRALVGERDDPASGISSLALAVTQEDPPSRADAELLVRVQIDEAVGTALDRIKGPPLVILGPRPYEPSPFLSFTPGGCR
jgi:hypothetical protein